MERLYVLAEIQKGLEQAEAGQTVSHEEAKRRIFEKVRWTDQAVEDLHSIRLFIERDSPRYGRLVAEGLYEATSRLELFPYSGRPNSRAGSRGHTRAHRRRLPHSYTR